MTDALCDDLRPEFVGVVDALAALKTVSDKKRRKSQGRGSFTR